MKPIDRQGIDALPTLPYAEVRQLVCPGDILLCSGDYLLSRAIRYVTQMPWSHAGLILPVWRLDRVLLLEAVGTGVRLSPLSRRFWGPDQTGMANHGPMVVVRHRDFAASPNTELGLRFGLDALTLPYSYSTIMKIFARVAMGWAISAQGQTEREFICSELVAHCLSHAGIEFDKHRTPGDWVTPGDIWLDPAVELVGRIS